MDDRLQRLKRELQSEKCPPHVLSRVRDRIAGERRRSTTWLRLPALSGAAVVLLLIALATFQWSKTWKPDRTPSPEVPVAVTDTSRVAEEATMSLACMGHILFEAGSHSEAVIRKEALPPLQNGFRTLQTLLKEPRQI